MSKGKLIAIEGLDGSGKATQAKLLAGYLAAQGLAVREVSFPDYGSDSSALVKCIWQGKFGQHPDDVNAYAASSFMRWTAMPATKRTGASFYREWRHRHCRPLHHLQRGAPVFQAAAGAVGEFSRLAV